MSYWRLWNKRSEPKYYSLVNHGATCYLNSVLHVLFMTEEFREAVSRFPSPSEEHIDHHLKELFAELIQRRVKIKYKILRALEVNNVNVQQDAAEYFERILRKTSENAAQENGIKMFFTPTIFDGENQMYCDNCDAKVDAVRKYVITHHPDVLLLVLKRFDFSYKYMSYIKVNCNAEVPHTLKIPENQTYELYAVVEHFGDLKSGHYNAIIRPKDEDAKWYIFNDDSVSPLDKNPFSDNAKITKSTDAYLLFYRSKNCSVRDPNPLTSQDSDKSQNKENLQEDDIHEKISHLDDSAQSDDDIKQLFDKEGIMDSLLTEAKPDIRKLEKGKLNNSGVIEKETHSQNERSDAHKLIEEPRDRKKETEARGQDDRQYTPDITENAESKEQEENGSFLSENDQIQDPDAGKKEPGKFGTIHANHDDSAVRTALQRQKKLREVHDSPVKSIDEGKQPEMKRKHEAENNKLSPIEDLSQYSQKTKQMKMVNILPDIHSNNKKQAQSVSTNEQTKLKETQRLKGKKEQTGNKVKYLKDKSQCSDRKRCNNVHRRLLNQSGSNLDNHHQSSNERIDDAPKTQTQESENKDEANYHQVSPNVDGGEERKLKDGESHITGNSGRNEKDQGKKEKNDNTDGVGKDLVTQSKDRQAEENSQAGKCVKQKTEYYENPKHPFHDEYTDNERRHTGQQDHPSNYGQNRLDLATTTKKKNHKVVATLTGNQGDERDKETSQERLLGYKSKGLQNAEASGHSSRKTITVGEIHLRGEGNKKILVKIIEEETLFN